MIYLKAILKVLKRIGLTLLGDLAGVFVILWICGLLMFAPLTIWGADVPLWVQIVVTLLYVIPIGFWTVARVCAAIEREYTKDVEP